MSVPRYCGLMSSRELEITEKWDARGLIEEMAEGRLTAVDVAGAFCKRAAIAHQLTLCLTEPLFTSALARARFLDNHLRENGTPLGPLHGLPISLKDTFHISGIDNSIGIASLCFKPATSNAPLVDLLLSLGAVIIAKTNVPQTLGALDSINNVFGRVRNPRDARVTAGGSSGGEGVLVAMRGSVVGFGTDIGGSIRIPAMCNAVYGFKPCVGRVPHGGHEAGQVAGQGRVGLQAVTGPIAGCVGDLGFVMGEVVPRAELWGEDCVPGGDWEGDVKGSGEGGRFVIGVLRRDGLVEPLPPVLSVIEEVVQKLRGTNGVEVVDVETPKAWAKCQSVANSLMGFDGEEHMFDLLESTGEPLIPWLQGRLKRRKPKSVAEVRALQAKRTEIEKEMLQMWNTVTPEGGRRRRIDAIICPVAPHPVPEIDRWNAVGYTSSFVLLDYPAGSVPVRDFAESDLELGKEMEGKVLGSWDERNRELWDEKTVDRTVYLGTPLSIQVVTPKLQDRRLLKATEIIDEAIRDKRPLAKL